MTLRREHSEAEIRELADGFRRSWSAGQVVKAWLRAHGEELQGLVQKEGWAWANLGRALGLADIVYKTGNPWTGENLRRAVALACKPTKLELRRARAAQAGGAERKAPEQTPQTATTVPPSEGEGEFRIVRRRPGAASRQSTAPTGQPSKEANHD